MKKFFGKIHSGLQFAFRDSKFGHFWVKAHLQFLVLALLMFAVKATMYFIVAYIPCEPIMFHMEIDKHIPFIPEFYIFYLSYNVLPVVFLWILSFYDRRKMVTIVLGTMAAIVVAYICYLIQQVKMDRVQYEIIAAEYHDFSKVNSLHTLWLWMIDKQYIADETALNCFPSLHAIMATSSILIGLWTGKSEKHFPIWMRLLFGIWGFLIFISTVFVKQHYFVDIIFGFGLVVVFYFIFKYLVVRPYLKHKEKKQQAQEEKQAEEATMEQ